MPLGTMIQRRRLTDFAGKMTDYKTLYIQAPAGYGKTVFAGQWLECQSGPGAVVTLDEYDNSLEKLCHKLKSLPEHLCPETELELVTSFTRHPDFEKAPAEFLMRALSALPGDSVAGIVIDDLHYLTDSRAQKLLLDSLMRLPDQARICILSRNHLPDIFSGQVLKQKLGFLPQDMLLFDSCEITALYQRKGISITEKQAEHILTCTEGWPIGISALLLSGHQFPTENISSEWLDGFLKTQVWDMWDEDSREFMIGTCMEDVLSESLCNALTGRCDSGILLEQMLVDGVFLLKQPDKTYRFHRLFRDFLRKLFLEKPEEYRNRQYLRAGAWYRERNDFYQAVRRFSACKDFDQVASCFDMLEEMERTEFDTEQVMQVVHDTLDEAIAEQYPFLYYMMAYTARNEGKTKEFHVYADLYYSNYPRIVERNPELAHNIFFLYAMDYRFSLKNVAKMAGTSQVSAMFRGVRGSATLYFPLYHRSFRDFSELLPGDIDEEVDALGQTLGMLLGEERNMLLDCIRGGLYYEVGDLQRARELALSAVAGLQPGFTPESKFCAFILLMMTNHAMQQPEQEAQVQMDIQDMIETDKAYYLQHNFDAVICRNRLDRGDTSHARHWLDHNGEDVHEEVTFYSLFGYFTTARAHIALGNLDQAVILLEKILELCRIMKRTIDMIEAEILLSIAHRKMKRGSRKTALMHLENAILLAQPLGYLQAFIDDSAGISALLSSLKNWTVRSDYTGQLSEVFVRKLYLRTTESSHSSWITAAKAAHAAALTPQQKRVAKLMCEGYSYRKIAEEMGIQFSTVRSHIELIYRKLDVTSMDEAIRKIQQFHLLDEPG